MWSAVRAAAALAPWRTRASAIRPGVWPSLSRLIAPPPRPPLRPPLSSLRSAWTAPATRPYSLWTASSLPPRLRTTPRLLVHPLARRGLASSTQPPPSLRTYLHYLRARVAGMFKRPSRPWTVDDVLAMASWLFVGNSLLLLVGTTTCVSVILWVANSFQFQELVARAVGWYLTRSTGATVIFESAIVPNWKDGKIALKNVTVRRMHALDESQLAPHYYYYSDEEAEELAAAAAASASSSSSKSSSGGSSSVVYASGTDPPQPPTASSLAAASISPPAAPGDVFTRPQLPRPPRPVSRDANNFTKYEVRIASIDVTLDLIRWLDGKGLVKDMVVKGVRGIIDRRDVFWDDDAVTPPRRVHQPGDFDMERVVIEDLFLTVYNPNFRPYSVSVFNADLPRLRKQWLLYDIICASSLVGLFDNCLFSLHTPQHPADLFVDPTTAGAAGILDANVQDDEAAGSDEWVGLPRRVTRLKVDGVPIDHLNYGTTGPFGWIIGGTLDITALIHIPRRPQEYTLQPDDLLAQLVGEIKASALGKIERVGGEDDDEDKSKRPTDRLRRRLRKVRESLRTKRDGDEGEELEEVEDPVVVEPAPVTSDLAASTDSPVEPAAPTADADPTTPPPTATTTTGRTLCMDLDLRFNNLRASVPLYSRDLPYLTTNALVRPVVGYMNAHRTAIPLTCRITLPLSNFDGAWTIYDSQLADALAMSIGRAMVRSMLDDADRARRIRKVGLWSVRTAAEAVAAVWQYVSGAKSLVHFLEGALRARAIEAAAAAPSHTVGVGVEPSARGRTGAEPWTG
ncbi:Mitochondrial distribution and morphology protein 31, mitochondrial precursor [Allomyces arbusculus]|nr:Mitochondrial distribution and morphology protein 31, mitochondrial precursor [Allomyces arbusculus]